MFEENEENSCVSQTNTDENRKVAEVQLRILPYLQNFSILTIQPEDLSYISSQDIVIHTGKQGKETARSFEGYCLGTKVMKASELFSEVDEKENKS